MEQIANLSTCKRCLGSNPSLSAYLGRVAQLDRASASKQTVIGSNPIAITILRLFEDKLYFDNLFILLIDVELQNLFFLYH